MTSQIWRLVTQERRWRRLLSVLPARGLHVLRHGQRLRRLRQLRLRLRRLRGVHERPRRMSNDVVRYLLSVLSGWIMREEYLTSDVSESKQSPQDLRYRLLLLVLGDNLSLKIRVGLGPHILKFHLRYITIIV